MPRISRVSAIFCAAVFTALLWAVLDRSLAIALLPLWLLLVPMLSGVHPGEDVVLRVLRSGTPRSRWSRPVRLAPVRERVFAFSLIGHAPAGPRAPPSATAC
jgi:hypothetical protein